MVALWINKELFIRLASSKEAVDEDEEGVAKPRELLLLVKRVVYVKLTSRFKIPSAPLSSSLSRSLSLSLSLSLRIPLSAGLVSHKFNFGGSFAGRGRRRRRCPTESLNSGRNFCSLTPKTAKKKGEK